MHDKSTATTERRTAVGSKRLCSKIRPCSCCCDTSWLDTAGQHVTLLVWPPSSLHSRPSDSLWLYWRHPFLLHALPNLCLGAPVLICTSWRLLPAARRATPTPPPPPLLSDQETRPCRAARFAHRWRTCKRKLKVSSCHFYLLGSPIQPDYQLLTNYNVWPVATHGRITWGKERASNAIHFRFTNGLFGLPYIPVGSWDVVLSIEKRLRGIGAGDHAQTDRLADRSLTGTASLAPAYLQMTVCDLHMCVARSLVLEPMLAKPEASASSIVLCARLVLVQGDALRPPSASERAKAVP